MNKVTIYHNPRCSKSRQALALLEARNIDINIIEYLATPPNKNQLSSLLKMLNCEPRDILRSSEQAYKDLGLNDTTLSNEQLIKAMVDNPKLIQRPIVICGDRAAIGRPPENVLEIL